MTAPVLIIRADPARPVHIHACVLEDGTAHQWECGSPYCPRIIRRCITHGGEAPRED